jgi:AcrR family transcriptional regulator
LSPNPEIWRKQPRQGRSANTVQNILEAAEQLFTARGYDETTAEDIVQRAGVGIGSLYDYFPNKKAVALALLESISESMANDARKLFAEHGREPIEVSLPKVARKIYFGYKRHKNVLINLVNDVPALRPLAELYALDKLINRTSLLYLQIYQDQYTEKHLESSHQFLNLVFTASIKYYLSEEHPSLDEDEFLTRLSDVVLVALMPPAAKSQPSSSVVPFRTEGG